MSKQELKMYNISLDSYRTNLAVRKNERLEGRTYDYAEGYAEGRAEAIKEIAASLKKGGITIDAIIQHTGLTKEEIKQL